MTTVLFFGTERSNIQILLKSISCTPGGIGEGSAHILGPSQVKMTTASAIPAPRRASVIRLSSDADAEQHRAPILWNRVFGVIDSARRCVLKVEEVFQDRKSTRLNSSHIP